MKILFATDGSEYSERAAEFLTRLQCSRDDAITVFHAIYEIPFHDDDAFHLSTLKSIKAEIAPRILDSAVAILKPSHASISVEIEESSPARCTPEQCIINAAESAGADLIVMGARGIKGIASALLGSVTRLVAINASKPVMVVKQTASSLSRPMKILFATDGSEPSLPPRSRPSGRPASCPGLRSRPSRPLRTQPGCALAPVCVGLEADGRAS